MNREVHHVGTVAFDDSSNKSVIAGIVLGIIAALVLGAALALIVMNHLRKKRRGERLFLDIFQYSGMFGNLVASFHMNLLSRPQLTCSRFFEL